MTPTANPCNTLNGKCNASWVDVRDGNESSGTNRRCEYTNALIFAGVNESFSQLPGLASAASNSRNKGVIACTQSLGKGAKDANPRRQSMYDKISLLSTQLDVVNPICCLVKGEVAETTNRRNASCAKTSFRSCLVEIPTRNFTRRVIALVAARCRLR